MDIDLKKAEEKDSDRKQLKKEIRKTLEDKYLDQGGSSKSERKAQGNAYFYKKLRF